jgi:chromosome segregation ATPase
VDFDQAGMQANVAIMREKEELKHRLEECEHLLQAERAEREDLEHEVASLREQTMAMAVKLQTSRAAEGWLSRQLEELMVRILLYCCPSFLPFLVCYDVSVSLVHLLMPACIL